MGLLKSMRETAGLSIRDMARDVSISEETYRRWEEGYIWDMTDMHVNRIAYVFGLPRRDWADFQYTLVREHPKRAQQVVFETPKVKICDNYADEKQKRNRRLRLMAAWAALTLAGHIALVIHIFTK